MKKFTSVNDVANLNDLVEEALAFKRNPYSSIERGKNKTLGLIFFNPSLRTRLSTQKAAYNLGINVISMNIDKEGWAIETNDGVVMNGGTVEHIREAAAVMGTYCDVIGIRSFAGLMDKCKDYSEELLNKFIQFSGVPIISLESATLHPLQSFADLITITENSSLFTRPKVVLCWAPHIKALPQAVPNSFAEWMNKADVDFVITHPIGYELDVKFSQNAEIIYDQQEAIEDADFIYVKNWSSFNEYGAMPGDFNDWMLTEDKLKAAPEARIMHCLPVRRGLELSDELIESSRSLIIQQADNRVWATQTILNRILNNVKYIHEQKEGQLEKMSL
jgi:N-succinyl-L-ornithine transcarbamylase